ncbi:MAG TPA: serine hydrolase domain-containing protein [Steroidobacteraceae bacterium]|nr:serine hydrolase domain-containing protein [Steroidobacteraceae bacterium]
MKSRHRLAAAFVTFFPLAGLAAVPPTFDAAVQDLARGWLADNGGVGLSIGVYEDGQRRYYNVGTSRVDGDKVPTKDTVYEIGSIAKTFAAQLLARAVVEGRASLDDEVTKYLAQPYPNFTRDGEPIRLLHLVNMTSQLVDNIPDMTQVRTVPGTPLPVTKMEVFTKYSREEMLRQLHRVAPRAAPGGDPGQSNVAAMLLMVVLEKIYDEPFDTLLAREIEKPLRMASGTAPPAKLLARGYTRANEELPPFEAPMAWVTGSLRYSARDLLEYAAWQVAERDASVKIAHRPTWATPDQKQGIAFYWLTGDSPHGRRLFYSGVTFGFAGMCDLYPDARVAIVLLANKDAQRAQETLRALSAKIAALARPPD